MANQFVSILQQEYQEALLRFEQVQDADVAGLEVDYHKTLARIGIAHCLAEKGEPVQAIELAREIINTARQADQEIHAKAYNVLGKCYRKQNQKKNAILAYLHTNLLYNRQRDAHAEALYHLTQLWEQSGRKDRSLDTRSLLKSRYGNSPWAKRL